MERRLTEAVELERVRRDTVCIIIRVGLGGYDLRGPQDNILVPESHVAWATVVNDLQGEGYVLVTPEEYAEATGTGTSEVAAKIDKEGSLFAIAYGESLVVPLPLKEAVFPTIEV